MRVLIINTSERTGGAAVAANRLKEALNNNGVKARMLVADKQSDDLTVAALPNEWRHRWSFLWERWCIFMNMHFSRNHLFEVDIANVGSDVTLLPEFQEADIVHLHWVNQGMLSLKSIRKIVESGKPIVWTMHDFWPATGICHYPHDCERYQTRCQQCLYLPSGGGKNDLAARVWQRKKHIWENSRMTFVGCSQWLTEQAIRSELLKGRKVLSIPNAIDTRVFCPGDKAASRQRLGLPLEKKLILFVSQRITDKRKGMDYFVQACERMTQDHGELKENAGIVILGGHAEEFRGKLPLPVYPIGYVSEEERILDVYRSADMFVLPSLEDNLPNTVMESMACGVPCVGFRTGGVPEMIDHLENGYVARYCDSEDLALGMYWVLGKSDIQELSRQAVRKVTVNYSQQNVARRYQEVYEELLGLS